MRDVMLGFLSPCEVAVLLIPSTSEPPQGNLHIRFCGATKAQSYIVFCLLPRWRSILPLPPYVRRARWCFVFTLLALGEKNTTKWEWIGFDQKLTKPAVCYAHQKLQIVGRFGELAHLRPKQHPSSRKRVQGIN